MMEHLSTLHVFYRLLMHMHICTLEEFNLFYCKFPNPVCVYVVSLHDYYVYISREQ